MKIDMSYEKVIYNGQMKKCYILIHSVVNGIVVHTKNIKGLLREYMLDFWGGDGSCVADFEL